MQAGRSNGFTAGLQFRPHGPMSQPLQYLHSNGFSKMSYDIEQHLSYAVAYSPEHSSTFGDCTAVFGCVGPSDFLHTRAAKHVCRRHSSDQQC